MGYDTNIERLPIFSLFDLKGPTETLADWAGAALPRFPDSPNSLTRRDGMELCLVGPDRWLLRADIGREDALLAALRSGDAPPEISIVRVSDTQCFFRVTGPDAGQILNIACPLDLHSSVFGDDAVSFTETFGQRALVLRCDNGFDLAVEQSFGDMIADYLSRATA